ncbi:MAG: hypothetical protein RBR02_06215 [Desulfuromonadaceae bacterium]|nr:hypothetical protein [Desulfuromonadaceae bacterium]
MKIIYGNYIHDKLLYVKDSHSILYDSKKIVRTDDKINTKYIEVSSFIIKNNYRNMDMSLEYLLTPYGYYNIKRNILYNTINDRLIINNVSYIYNYDTHKFNIDSEISYDNEGEDDDERFNIYRQSNKTSI